MATNEHVVETEEVAGPRRSSRITSTSKAVVETVVAMVSEKKKPGRKRKAAEEGGENNDVSKKPKPEADSANNEGQASEEPPVKELEIGDPLPNITIKNEKNEDVQVQTLTRDKGVIFFLVAKADTPGCTTQACGFRDNYSDFTNTGYDVYCLSADSPSAQLKWQTKKSLPYPLLSDPKRLLISALGAGKNNKTQRSHFVFEKSADGVVGGKLVDKRLPVKPADSPRLALEFVKSHKVESPS